MTETICQCYTGHAVTKNAEILSFVTLMGALLLTLYLYQVFSIYFSTYARWLVLSS